MHIILMFTQNPAFEETLRDAIGTQDLVFDAVSGLQDFTWYFPGNFPCLTLIDCNSISDEESKLIRDTLSLRYPCRIILCRNISHDILQAEYLSDLISDLRKKSVPIPLENLFPLDEIRDFSARICDPLSCSFDFRSYKNIFPMYQFFSCLTDVPSKKNRLSLLALLTRYFKGFTLLPFRGSVYILICWAHVDDYENFANFRGHFIHKMHTLPSYRYIPQIFFGCIHNSLFGVYKSFLEAKETFYINKLYHKADSFDEISSITKHAVKPMGLVLIERQIRSDLEYRNGESVIRLVQEWFEESLREGHDLEDIQMDLLNLYSSIKYVIFDMYTLHGTRIKNGWEAYEIFKIQTVDELREWFFDWINYTLNNVQVKKSQGFNIEDIKEFIEHHLMDHLTLENTASFFGYNQSYFSTMFKKETQETFISYVSREKMKKAYELLKGGHKVSETASLLGYNDLKYFRTLFRQYFQVTPSSVLKQKD